MPEMNLSLIVPTRHRPGSLRRLLDSLIATASDHSRIEVVLVVDEDAVPSLADIDPRLLIRSVVVPPGQTMGALNVAGCEAARGDFLMLLNDDVVVRTPGWDDRLLAAARQFSDGIVLVHVNDTLMRHHLCTFPLVSRLACDIMGGICPREYLRYRIDDHIEDIFNLLGVLGERRTIYLPEVVFEHANAVKLACGVREYHANPAILGLDVPRFEALHSRRKEIALQFFDHIDQHRRERRRRRHEARLANITDPFTLRTPERLKTTPPSASLPESPPRVGLIVVSNEGPNREFGISVRAATVRERESNRSLTVAARTKGRNPLPNSRGSDGIVSTLSRRGSSEVLTISRSSEPNLAHRINEICRSSSADYLVIMEEGVQVPPDWLDRLLACLQPDVAVVTPLRRVGGNAMHGGLVFAPDGSGHHSAWTTPLPGVVPAFSFSSPIVLLDRAKVEQLDFDESFGRYFFDCDLGLRAWEQGWQVVVTPEVVAEVANATPFDEAAFETDRQRFVEVWTDSGRFDRLRQARWEGIPSLRHWLTLADEGNPSATALAAMRHCPILLHYLQPRPVERTPGRFTLMVQRLRRCWNERGVLGLVKAISKRVAKFYPRRVKVVPNRTREAAERLR